MGPNGQKNTANLHKNTDESPVCGYSRGTLSTMNRGDLRPATGLGAALPALWRSAMTQERSISGPLIGGWPGAPLFPRPLPVSLRRAVR